MVLKRKLDNLQDWQDWYDWNSKKFGNRIINGDTETPNNYPCIISWHEYEDRYDGDDICVYNFIYLSDFVNE